MDTAAGCLGFAEGFHTFIGHGPLKFGERLCICFKEIVPYDGRIRVIHDLQIPPRAAFDLVYLDVDGCPVLGETRTEWGEYDLRIFVDGNVPICTMVNAASRTQCATSAAKVRVRGSAGKGIGQLMGRSRP